MRSLAAVSVFFVFFLIFSFGGGVATMASEGTHPLFFSLSLDRETYQEGDPVACSYLLLNRGEEKTLTFRSSQFHELQLYREGRSIWTWSKGQFFLTMITEEVFQQGEYRHEVFLLPQEVTDRLVPGEYKIRVSILSEPEPLVAEVDFIVN